MGGCRNPFPPFVFISVAETMEQEKREVRMIKIGFSIVVFSVITILSSAYINLEGHRKRLEVRQTELYNCLDLLESIPRDIKSDCNKELCTVSYGNQYDKQLTRCQIIEEKLEKSFQVYDSLPQKNWF